MSGDDDGTLWAESTRGPDDEPVCRLAWGPDRWHAPVDEIRKTALDLVSCAAYAEMMMLLVGKLSLPGSTASAFITDLLNSRGGRGFGSGATVDLVPAGSTKTGDAVVLIGRRGRRGHLFPAEARSMALQWLAAAEATESDQLVSEALRGTGLEDSAERVFGHLRELRKEKA